MTRYSQVYDSFLGYEEKEYVMEYLSVDEQGNWTERVVKQDDKPVYMQERIITYY